LTQQRTFVKKKKVGEKGYRNKGKKALAKFGLL